MVNVSGPFDLWPTQTGFDKFYGYIAGEQSLFHPNLIDRTTCIGIPKDPEYHFNTDLTNKAVEWIKATRSLTPDRPFMMYYAQSASHPPHTPPPSWLKKDLYKGKFDQGWDAVREEILERQIEIELNGLVQRRNGQILKDRVVGDSGHRPAGHQARGEPGIGAEMAGPLGR